MSAVGGVGGGGSVGTTIGQGGTGGSTNPPPEFVNQLKLGNGTQTGTTA